MSEYRIETKCVQGGYTPGNGEPRQIPIYQSTTFKYDTSEHMGQLFVWRHPAISIPDCKTPPAIWLPQKLLHWKAAQQQC